MSDKIKIIIDDREQSIIPFFNGYDIPDNIEVCVKRVNVGDYNVVYKGNVLFSIERKTWKDLASSIKDGRKNNISKMIELRKNTGCSLFYLIEGNPIPSRDSKFCRIPYKNLRSHLDHLMLRDNVFIIHSKSQKNTVFRIIQLIENYISIKPCPLLEFEEIKDDTVFNIKIDEDAVIYKIWSCIPNITEKTACIFIKRGYHISDLILGHIKESDIYSMNYDNGFIIGKRSKKIWSCSRYNDNNKKYFIKMLSQINGLTIKTAAIILDTVNFENVLKGGITENEISKIEKNENRKIGPKLANLIIKYFTKLNN